MKAARTHASVPPAAVTIAAAIVAGAAAGLWAFAAEGTGLFVTLLQTGLAWCL
ncbi:MULTISPECIES: hypothetical protein [unclassified Roseitalea]|uniref:hypothetical protein n=1 Tax=unclassified Roseitalea TaxID=2639107 RepID=UPI00273E405C|nr:MULTISPECIES: hypothetical protein [unclassified Roseitalea]